MKRNRTRSYSSIVSAAVVTAPVSTIIHWIIDIGDLNCSVGIAPTRRWRNALKWLNKNTTYLSVLLFFFNVLILVFGFLLLLPSIIMQCCCCCCCCLPNNYVACVVFVELLQLIDYCKQYFVMLSIRTLLLLLLLLCLCQRRRTRCTSTIGRIIKDEKRKTIIYAAADVVAVSILSSFSFSTFASTLLRRQWSVCCSILLLVLYLVEPPGAVLLCLRFDHFFPRLRTPSLVNERQAAPVVKKPGLLIGLESIWSLLLLLLLLLLCLYRRPRTRCTKTIGRNLCLHTTTTAMIQLLFHSSSCSLFVGVIGAVILRLRCVRLFLLWTNAKPRRTSRQ